ncbi:MULTISPECIES: hypothetical protein [Roseobacteraceae]|jgi:hypothetical protein|uniref:Uncharacterized protein n=1 Tax=Celeribacter baekdonensis TaxID=875171 RepID=A0A1G7T4C8_9RHOB|nr:MULTISPECIES: hypothetical protein [Roseobacteraceae]MBU0642638.1 hypothetical protein [Alphaproteobacteria bacterium]AVW90046.1 hypothetical protein DA792_02315 [Celeribacter baekdonensis]KAB6717169.1 hypothetical protein C8029_05845 [Roseobacter sp. TSBP12]MBU1280068.1 hypothetical protein [Alphaproteobacteria bacterium]MBU1827402.1 hypothetical protein [Alphaproteobacteria bacterium]
MSVHGAFTFDTDNVDPAAQFHMPSLVEEPELQRIAVRVAHNHPDVVTVADYRRLPFEKLRMILSNLKLPPRKVQRFTAAVSVYTEAVD